MGRIRTIKPDFWKHEDLSALPEATHMLAAALLNYADDEGYFNANPGLIKAETSPLREPSITVPESLQSLAEIGYVRLGSAPDGKRYGHIVEFTTHQVVSKPRASKIKTLNITWESSGNTTGNVQERSSPEEGREEGIRDKEESPPEVPPEGEPEPDLIEWAVGKWNETASKHGLPRVETVTKQRRAALRQRLKGKDGRDRFLRALRAMEESPHWLGDNERGWLGNLDSLLREKNFTKLLEGGYATKPRDGPDPAKEPPPGVDPVEWYANRGWENGTTQH